jgi:hypothetical protein
VIAYIAEKRIPLLGQNHFPYRDAAETLSNHIGRKISYVNIPEGDARKLITDMGMNEWHTNILLDLLRLSREGYLSNISNAVEEVTGKQPISFSQFSKDYAESFR